MFDAMDPNIPSSTQIGISIPQANPSTTTPSLVHTTPLQTTFAQSASPFTPFTAAIAAPQPSFPNPPISQISASIFAQTQQFTIGMPSMGPSNQPFIAPSLFTSAQSTIPSFFLSSWSLVPPLVTNPQATTLIPPSYQNPQATTHIPPSFQVSQAPISIPLSFQIQPPSFQNPSLPLPIFQIPPPPPPVNPLPPITNYFFMPLLGGNPPPPPITNYLAPFSIHIPS